MLSALAKEHQTNQSTRKSQLERKRLTAFEATNKFSFYLTNQLNKDVSKAFVNQKKIDYRIKQINQNSSQFVKNSQQWMTILDNFNTALKELGDVENWSRKIETDMKTINTILNEVDSKNKKEISSQ